MKALSQDAWVLAQLERGRSLSQNEAFKEYGITRLAARVNRLRNDGHNIKSALVEAFNRRGELVRIARYWIKRSSK
jgi:hypothetical protein